MLTQLADQASRTNGTTFHPHGGQRPLTQPAHHTATEPHRGQQPPTPTQRVDQAHHANGTTTKPHGNQRPLAPATHPNHTTAHSHRGQRPPTPAQTHGTTEPAGQPPMLAHHSTTEPLADQRPPTLTQPTNQTHHTNNTTKAAGQPPMPTDHTTPTQHTDNTIEPLSGRRPLVFAELADHADQAWRAGDTTAAIEAADRVLAAGTDPYCLAAGVAAAAAAADGALFDAAARWRDIAASSTGAGAAFASGRAALAAALVGDLDAAERDLDAARQVSGPAPRGLTVLLDGVTAALNAVRGDFAAAARKVAGLAVANVPADPHAAERWDDLAMTVLAAGEDDDTARALFTSSSPRRLLVNAWLDLRAGRLADARAGVVAASAAPVLRRDAVLAAAVSVGLARRAGDRQALRTTWHRVAPVVMGADVEILQLDAWGELAAAAEPVDREMIVAGMTAAVTRAGNPAWATATLAWWALQRATTADEARAAAAQLPDTPRGRAGRVWAAVLAGTVDPAAVREAAAALTDRPWEAATLCGTAAARAKDPASVKHLLGKGRALRATVTQEDTTAGVLSKRERAVGELLLDGLTHKEIGAKLYISPKTVEQHVARIRQKLPAANRAELIAALRAALS